MPLSFLKPSTIKQADNHGRGFVPQTLPEHAADLGDGKITLNLPKSVLRQLRVQTVARETTIRALMLQALAGAGYAVPADEIRDRRRRATSSASSS